MSAQSHPEQLDLLVQRLLREASFRSAIFSQPRESQPGATRKVAVKPVVIKSQARVQFEYHTENKATHRNLTPEEAEQHLLELLPGQFCQAQIFAADADYQVQVRAKQVVIKRRPASRATIPLSHDRAKSYLLPDNQPVDFLVRLGVMGESGKVLQARYDKFRQINRFLEMVDDIIDHLPTGKTLNVVDFGCGKSYLTFALRYYLTQTRGRTVNIVGLDLKEDVVATCNQIVTDLGYTDIRFLVGDIRGFAGFEKVDLVVSLHACDTATDDALAKAIAWNAEVILAVPCCQHELSRQIESDVLQPLLKYGILRERIAALVTDGIRAGVLEQAGYGVQILEFIDMEHTPKNLLIRAVKQTKTVSEHRLSAENCALREFLHLNPYLDSLLHENEPHQSNE